jgi:hypothetical protein
MLAEVQSGESTPAASESLRLPTILTERLLLQAFFQVSDTLLAHP